MSTLPPPPWLLVKHRQAFPGFALSHDRVDGLTLLGEDAFLAHSLTTDPVFILARPRLRAPSAGTQAPRGRAHETKPE